MLFWILSAALTVGVIYVLARPLLRAPESVGVGAASADARVYKDQLAEVESDLARGLLTPAEAAAARVEISRRLLASATPADAAAPLRPSLSVRTVYAGLAVAVPVLSLALYLAVGRPGMPDAPRAGLEPTGARPPIGELVAQVEQRLREHPEDGMGWDVIAPVYYRLERYTDAAEAFRRAGALLGENAARLSGYAAATIEANNGVVTDPARRAYERVLQLDPKDAEARFWLAFAKEQDGDRAAAAADYKSLLADAPGDAPWRDTVLEHLRQIDPKAASAKSPARPPSAPAGRQPPPSPEAAGAIASLPEAERAKVIAGMVENLATRLRQNGNDLPGWQRLLQAYTVMGEKQKAQDALADARKALAKDAAALQSLETFARDIGLGS